MENIMLYKNLEKVLSELSKEKGVEGIYLRNLTNFDSQPLNTSNRLSIIPVYNMLYYDERKEPGRVYDLTDKIGISTSMYKHVFNQEYDATYNKPWAAIETYFSYMLYDPKGDMEKLKEWIYKNFHNHPEWKSYLDNENKRAEFYTKMYQGLELAKKTNMKTVISLDLLRKTKCLNCGFDVVLKNEARGYNQNGEMECPECGTKYLVDKISFLKAIKEGMTTHENIRVYEDDYFNGKLDFNFNTSEGYDFKLSSYTKHIK